MPSFTKRNARAIAKERLKKSLRAFASDPTKSCNKLVKASIATERENRKIVNQKAIVVICKLEAISPPIYADCKAFNDTLVIYSKEPTDSDDEWTDDEYTDLRSESVGDEFDRKINIWEW